MEKIIRNVAREKNAREKNTRDINLCRFCLFEPESNRTVQIFNIFPKAAGDPDLSQPIKELLDITVLRDDIKPKIICEKCHNFLINWGSTKKQFKGSEALIDRIIEKVKNKQSPKSEPTKLDLPLRVENDNQLPSTSSTNPNSNLLNHHETTLENSCGFPRIKIKTDVACTNSPEDNVISVSDSDSDSDVIIIDAQETLARAMTDNISISDNRIKNNKKTNALNKCNVRTLDLTLFTCLKPNCNYIFQSFTGFQKHYRKHFKIEKSLLFCWQCFTQFPNKIEFLRHNQRRCQKIGMFECFECGAKYSNLQSLSVHKLIAHKCSFDNINKKTITCPFCKKDCNLSEHKTHLHVCQQKYFKSYQYPETQSPELYHFTPNLTTFICTYCKLIRSSVESLESHFEVCPEYTKTKVCITTQRLHGCIK